MAHSSTVASELCDVSGAGKLQNGALFTHTDGSSLSPYTMRLRVRKVSISLLGSKASCFLRVRFEWDN